MRVQGNFQEESLDVNVILNSKNKITTDVYYKDRNIHDYLPHDSTHPESCKKSETFNLTKQIVFSTHPVKVELRFSHILVRIAKSVIKFLR